MSDELPRDAPASASPLLRDLWPLVLKFGFSDDSARERILEDSSDEELTGLLDAVNKEVFNAINSYLDETDNSEESVPYGDLAQAAMEAAQVLAGHRS